MSIISSLGRALKNELFLKFNLIEEELGGMKSGIFPISKEGVKRNLISKAYEYQSVINKNCLAALIVSPDLTKLLIKKLKKLSKSSKIDR